MHLVTPYSLPTTLTFIILHARRPDTTKPMSISMGENSIFQERRPDTDKLISVPLGENSTQGIILAMRQERLETEIFLYAAEGLSHDVDVERQIRNSLV